MASFLDFAQLFLAVRLCTVSSFLDLRFWGSGLDIIAVAELSRSVSIGEEVS